MDPALRKAAYEGDVKSLQELVAVKPDVIYSTTRKEENIALHIAASEGHTLFVHHFLLLQYIATDGELTVSQNVRGDTPMHLAVRRGHLEVVEHLIQYLAWARGIGANFQEPTMMKNEEGNTPLHDALFHRKSNVLKHLDACPRFHPKLDIALKLLDANPRCAHALNKEMQSPLYLAAREGLLHVVKKIADQGSMAPVSTIGTALHKAVSDDSIRALKILLDNIVKLVELTDSSGNNALHYAAWHNRARMVSMLHNKNTTLAYEKNDEQHTPLHMAAKYGSAEAANELLKQCPDAIKMADNHGRNAFHVAAINDKVNMLELLLKCEVPYEILNQQDGDGNTPLHYAAKLCQRQPIRRLLNDPRINPLVIDKYGHTVWDYEIPRDLVAQIRRVLMGQALPNAINKGDVLRLVKLLAGNPYMVYSMTLNERNTALHLAALSGNDWIVHFVLFYTNRNVGIIVTKNVDGDTPLHLAVRAGHLGVVEHLIRYVGWSREIEAKLKEPLIFQNNKGNTLLHEAVTRSMYHVMVKLLEGAKDVKWEDPEETIKEYDACADDVFSIYDALLIIKNGDGDTPLHLAAKTGNLDFSNLLLGTRYAKGQIIMANKEGNIPLHGAVLYRKSEIALKLLEANPKCSHMSNVAGQSPFYIAVRDGLTRVVRKIAGQGLSVDFVSTHGTALHQSVVGNNIRTFEILLDKYVELVESTDSSGNNALHYAAQYNNARIVSILLRKNSTLAYKQNNEKHTPLHVAANYGSMKAAKELLKQCPDVIEKVDTMGRNAIHIAVINGNVKMLELLLTYVVPEGIVNKPDRDGNTPLHHGARLCLLQPTLLLLNDPRVDPSLFNHDGNTAFALSRRAVIMEVTADEMKLWKDLKKHESSRCKQQRVTMEKFQLRWRRSPYNDLSIQTIVATLMSMATFTATLTMPGGYSRQSGTAIVGHHQAFKIFVICNTISMCGSIVLILCFLLGWRDPGKVKLSMLIWANRLVVLSSLTMIMSMLTAVYLTIASVSQWVAYVVVAIGASTAFLGFLIHLKIMLSTR